MSKAAYWQRGEAIDYTNNTGETIEANTIVALGALVGVAGTDIADGETGSLHITGIWEIEKAESEELKAGDVVALTDGKVGKCAEGGTPAGVAVADAAAADTVALVKINMGTAPAQA